MLSKKAQSLKPSPTLQLVAKAKDLANLGHDVIALSVGEPDWPTFQKASNAGKSAIDEGFSKYTPTNGIAELREAICQQIKKDHGFEFTPQQVTVGTGAKFILFAAFQMLCNEGDEVIIPAPYWVSYPVMVELAQGRSVIINCDEKSNFKITPQKLENAITPKTKVFIFASPSNPTGLAYTKDELKALAQVLIRNPQVFIITDDIYNHLMFGNQKVAPHLLDLAPELKERMLIVNGVSKSYSMTGWRIGWGIGPSPLIKAMADYQSQSTSSASSISQKAALAAILECDQDLIQANELLRNRLTEALTLIESIPLIRAIRPDGAFYLWMDISKTFGLRYQGQVIENSRDFATLLLEKYFVAAVPGVEFGMEGYMRISFAIDSKRMKQALLRLQEMVQSLG